MFPSFMVYVVNIFIYFILAYTQLYIQLLNITGYVFISYSILYHVCDKIFA